MDTANHIDQLLVQLMDQFGDYLKRTAYLYLGDAQIAEDMTQETFISFYKKYHTFNHQASYKTYLYRILMNHCKMHVRKHKKTIEMQNTESTTSFESSVVNRQYMVEQISTLDIKSREVVILYYYNQWSIEDISTTLNISKSSTKMRLKRAREKLKKSLEKEDCYEN